MPLGSRPALNGRKLWWWRTLANGTCQDLELVVRVEGPPVKYPGELRGRAAHCTAGHIHRATTNLQQTRNYVFFASINSFFSCKQGRTKGLLKLNCLLSLNFSHALKKWWKRSMLILEKTVCRWHRTRPHTDTVHSGGLCKPVSRIFKYFRYIWSLSRHFSRLLFL